MLSELLKSGGVELARRWIAALMLAPEDERETIVSEVERRMAREYRSGAGRSPADDDSLGPSGLERVPLHPRRELRELAAAVKAVEADDRSASPIGRAERKRVNKDASPPPAKPKRGEGRESNPNAPARKNPTKKAGKSGAASRRAQRTDRGNRKAATDESTTDAATRRPGGRARSRKKP